MNDKIQNSAELSSKLIEKTCQANSAKQAAGKITDFLKKLFGSDCVSAFDIVFGDDKKLHLINMENDSKTSLPLKIILEKLQEYSGKRLPEKIARETGIGADSCVYVTGGESNYIFSVDTNNKSSGYETKIAWFNNQFPSLAQVIAERADLLEQVYQAGFRERLKELNISVLQDIGVAVTGTLDIGELTGELIQRLVTVMNINRAAVILSDVMDRRARGGGVRRVARSFGCDDEEIESLLELVDKLSVWEKLETQPLVELGSGTGIEDAINCGNALAAGIINRGEVLGMVIAGGKEERGTTNPDFDDNDKNLLVSVANFAGTALANSRLYNNVLQMKKFNDDILRSIANGVITTDSNGQIDSFNSSAEKIFGLDGDKVRGMYILEFFRHVGADKAAEILDSNLVNGGTLQQTRLKGFNSSGEELVFNLSANSFRDFTDDKEKVRSGSLVISIENISEHARIREMLSSYVSPSVAEFALSEHRKLVLGGEKKEVTVLFADIRGFTHLSETREPEEIVELLNSFFDLMIETVFNFGGTVDKTIGDEIMVLFGAPFEFSDDTSRAVSCALNMLEELEVFNKTRAERGLFPINIGIGINHGRVVSGNIGSTRQMSYTVIGDAVNIAKRLVDIAEPGQILVSAAVKDKLNENEFEAEPIGEPVKVKGRSEAVNLYEIKGFIRMERKEKMPEMSKYRVISDTEYRATTGIEVKIADSACTAASDIGFGIELQEEIRLAVIEAVINAIEHGSGTGGKIVVRLAEILDKGTFVVMIQDFGSGFDSDSTETPDIKDKIHVKGSYKRGWGLKLMREMMDEVRIDSDDDGTIITLVKHRADA